MTPRIPIDNYLFFPLRHSAALREKILFIAQRRSGAQRKNKPLITSGDGDVYGDVYVYGDGDVYEDGDVYVYGDGNGDGDGDGDGGIFQIFPGYI